MRFPNWVCSNCGRPFGRKWNGQRHVQLYHYGFGALVSFIDYLSGRQSGIYPSRSPPSYGRRSTSYFDIYADEFNRALARESVNRFFHPSQSGIKNNFNNVGNISRFDHHDPGEIDKIFGFRAHACGKCLTMEALKVYFVDNKTKDVTRKEERHICNPQWVDEAQRLTNRDIYVKQASDKLPEYLKTIIKAWTKNKTHLTATELQHLPSDNSIKIMQATNPQNSITLQYSRERIITLASSQQTNEQNDWANRAIKSKLTSLNDEEVEDFCQKVKDATFAFFKVKDEKGSAHLYLMAIANNNHDNNIKSILSLADDQRNSGYLQFNT
jgi:hypothetical protein